MDHILNIFALAFSQRINISYFKRKFLENPFGDSLHVLSYDRHNNLVATRVLWKLDSHSHYQCVDTAVHPSYQGRGLFKLSTAYILNTFPDLCFYNKPNSNSLPQYLKYGWKIDQIQNLSLSSRFNPRFLSSIPVLYWSLPQLNWRLSLTNYNCYSQFFYNGYYYVSTKKRNFFDMLLFKTPFNLGLPPSNSFLFFSFDGTSSFNLPYTQTLLSSCPYSYVPPSFYYDMT